MFFTKFHLNRMKNKKVSMTACLMDESSIKLLLGEEWIQPLICVGKKMTINKNNRFSNAMAFWFVILPFQQKRLASFLTNKTATSWNTNTMQRFKLKMHLLFCFAEKKIHTTLFHPQMHVINIGIPPIIKPIRIKGPLGQLQM